MYPNGGNKANFRVKTIYIVEKDQSTLPDNDRGISRIRDLSHDKNLPIILVP